MPFEFEAAVDHFLASTKYRNYLVKSSQKVETFFIENCIAKLRAEELEGELKIIFGEATQNTTNYIYGESTNGIRGNNFLKPAMVLGKPCGKETDFKVEDLHNSLAKLQVMVVDVFPLALPSEVYRNGAVDLGAFQLSYLTHKVDTLIKLIDRKKVNSIKAICRYSEETIKTQASLFIDKLGIALPNFPITLLSGSLSNSSGGLDEEGFCNFIGRPYTPKTKK